MKRSVLLFSLLICSLISFGQVAGNINYRKRVKLSSVLPGLGFRSNQELYVKVKGMYNVKADAYVAIFSIQEVGKNQKELIRAMNAKIDSIKAQCKSLDQKNEVFIDMISFVPLYEFELSKKIFSRKSYKEIPIGFELRQNIHFRFTDSDVLNRLVEICALHDVYDLVRVDYLVNDMEKIKQEMVKKAEEKLNEKLALHKKWRDLDLKEKTKNISEQFSVFYPVEKYSSYQAYANNSIRTKRAPTKSAQKTTNLFYMPLMNKDFDFVKNAVIHEPVVQVVYEIQIHVDLKEKPKKKEEKPKTEKVIEKQLWFLSPKGDLKKVNY